ncbi:Inner membrane protein YedI [bacterium YEK0313]|nr:Inner membrane protein YedI [bacterium YEK0313]
MSIGLIALLDDVAAIAKAAAASLDDITTQAAKAGAKAAGVVIDAAAVTPRYVTGFTPDRELPAIARIAVGSLRNKLLILLPAALGLAVFAPWLITPLLMLGGAYLCYEGAEKVFEAVLPHQADAHEAEIGTIALDAASIEDQKVASAIKTDFILSAEIMAITLASIPSGSFWMQAVVLAVVGLGITVAVYGVVGLIVKADDIGLALARNEAASAFAAVGRVIGRGLVRGMPMILALLGLVGTAAMIWVGGGIIVHGLEGYGSHAVAGLIEAAAGAAAGRAGGPRRPGRMGGVGARCGPHRAGDRRGADPPRRLRPGACLARRQERRPASRLTARDFF